MQNAYFIIIIVVVVVVVIVIIIKRIFNNNYFVTEYHNSELASVFSIRMGYFNFSLKTAITLSYLRLIILAMQL